MEPQFLNVGKIVNTHGIKGEVRVISSTDFEERFEPGSVLFITSKENTEPVKVIVSSHRKHKQFDLLTFEGYEDLNQVEVFKNSILQVDQSQLHELEEHAYYYYEIIGCEVYLESGQYIGVIKEILAPGANDVWVVDRGHSKEVLIPYIEDVVKEINIDQKRIWIEEMEGLLS
ncbi:ribosome maturation factor RimM [Halalkalibacillus halophilus]|uniref:ribosome maturation factor RimM n=1 Tax=Halalkalibacillus halophilus TaxID=392827 RepID=UPI0004093D2D|nr:ribosome maturation factor RimM [Halalkalibacillus halophilus]